MRALTMDELKFVSGGGEPMAPSWGFVGSDGVVNIFAKGGNTITVSPGSILAMAGTGSGARRGPGGQNGASDDSVNTGDEGCNGLQLIYDFGQSLDAIIDGRDLNGDGDLADEREFLALYITGAAGGALAGGVLGAIFAAGITYGAIQTALDRGYINTQGC